MTMTTLQNVYLLARDVPKLGQVAIGPFSNQNEIERLFEIVDRSKFELNFAIMTPDEFVRRFGAAFRIPAAETGPVTGEPVSGEPMSAAQPVPTAAQPVPGHDTRSSSRATGRGESTGHGRRAT
jgi:hypothetical protein